MRPPETLAPKALQPPYVPERRNVSVSHIYGHRFEVSKKVAEESAGITGVLLQRLRLQHMAPDPHTILIGLQCPVLAELTAGEAGAGCCTGANTSHVFDARHDLPSRHGRNLDLSHRSELAPSFPAFHSRRAAWRRTLPLALLGLALAYLRLNFNVALPGIGL